VDDEHQRRLASNEAVFREVNEGIERGQWPGDEDQLVSFRCECARLGCNALVELRLDEYESVRSDPCQFLMIPGHELPELEAVVEPTPAFVIVRKDGEAGRHADETDPRS